MDLFILFIYVWLISSMIIGSIFFYVLYIQLDCWSFNKWFSVDSNFTEREYEILRQMSIIFVLTPLSIIMISYSIYHMIKEVTSK